MMEKQKSNTALVKSHIQAPRFLLKRFIKTDNGFAKYQIGDGYPAKHGNIGDTNVSPGYYSKECEKMLNTDVEAPFSCELRKLESWDLESQDVVINPEPIWRFVDALIYRDPVSHRWVKDHSLLRIFQGTCGESFLNDQCIINGAKVVQELGIRDKYNAITVFLNKTNVPFVLPMMGVYAYHMQEEDYINLPVGPYMAICLMNKQGATVGGDGPDEMLVRFTDNPCVIMWLNEVAFETQAAMGEGFVICSEDDELDRLVKIHLNAVSKNSCSRSEQQGFIGN